MSDIVQILRREILKSEHEGSELQQWRSQVLSGILFLGFLLGSITAIPSVTLAVREGVWAIALIDCIAIIWVFILWRRPQIPFRTRAWHLVSLLYLLGILFLLKVGPVSQIYLMAFPAMTAMLIGLRPALYALVFNAISLFFVGYLSHAAIYVPHLSEQPIAQWVVITLNFSFISAIITISCGVLLQRLERSLEGYLTIAESLKKEQGNLRSANAELRLNTAALARLNDIVIIMDVIDPQIGAFHIVFVNDAFERRSGYSMAEVMGKAPRILFGEHTQKNELRRLTQLLIAGEPAHCELIQYTKSGEQFWVEVDIVPLTDGDSNLTHWVAVERDISERKKAEAHIYRLAYFDELTELPNRRLLLDRLEILLATARRTNLFSAVLFIDLDHFKYINEARGHKIGDEVLVQISKRLKTMLREVDTVARVGGDEFVVLVSNIGSDINAAALFALAIAEKLKANLSVPITIDEQAYNLACSIGVSLLPKVGQRADDLMREADTAMNRVKASGRNQVAFFEETMQADVEHRLTMERDLLHAIEHGELQMVMQAQVDKNGHPEGAELLMRWTHPVQGPISPLRFIPIAEESGIIVQLGDWALLQGCLALLHLEAAGWPLNLSVNVSPKQFRQADFVAKLSTLLQQTKAPPERLILEVTEGLLIDDFQGTVQKMQALTAMGVRFSIDDFGTGYSSLGYLQKLPLYELKIDKSFVNEIVAASKNTAIIQLILSMANHLELRVVAEGVETQEQATFLIEHGCSSLQGYLYCRPMPIDDWINQNRFRLAPLEV